MRTTNRLQNRLPLDKAPLRSLNELEYLLGVSREELLRLAECDKHYCPFQLEKAAKPHCKLAEPSKLRNIDNPLEELKAVQSKILTRLLYPVQLPGFLFGAVRKRSIRDHASAHLGSSIVVKMDIKSYYPNITSHHVYHVWRVVLECSPEVASLLTRLTTYSYHLPQGAPTSPALANLFLASIYSPILAQCKEKGITASAWVDDLTFSGRDAREIIETVRQVLAAHGFKDSRKKRAVLGPRQAKVITGVRIGKDGPRACRIKMREVRAGIANLRKGKITERGFDKDVQSLRGKIVHIRSLCAADAIQLQNQLDNALSTRSSSPLGQQTAAPALPGLSSH